jgi:hypothetical protein
MLTTISLMVGFIGLEGARFLVTKHGVKPLIIT